MCILALAWRSHPRWHLILAGNRDEHHARPATPLARWQETPGLIAGRDLQSGGTWLGISEAGRASIVTNLRGYGGPLPDRASRGALVAELLAGTGPYSDAATATLDDFNPFNLIYIDQDEAHFLTNRPRPSRIALMPGLYGLSNGALDAPWPKTLQLKAALLNWLVTDAADPDGLFVPLRSERLSDAGLHPDAPSDILDESAASPVFIRNPVYGTRCSTVIAIGDDGHGMIIERRFDADARDAGESRVAFRWPR